ncbi:hypothetical protein G6F35_015587 [Rhizopus arrhizus]|nr:hypothetical protein G6F35_015587 [Rhizopus arrhizus]
MVGVLTGARTPPPLPPLPPMLCATTPLLCAAAVLIVPSLAKTTRDGTAGIVAYLRRDRDGARVGHPAVAAATTDALCQHAVALRAQRRDRALAGLRERHGARRTAIAALAAGCHRHVQPDADAHGIGRPAAAAAATDALEDDAGGIGRASQDLALR